MGIAAALVFCNLGASYGTAKAGVGIASLSVIQPTRVFRGLIPIVMAGILGIYGLIVAVIYQGRSKYRTFISEKLAEKGLFYRYG